MLNKYPHTFRKYFVLYAWIIKIAHVSYLLIFYHAKSHPSLIYHVFKSRDQRRCGRKVNGSITNKNTFSPYLNAEFHKQIRGAGYLYFQIKLFNRRIRRLISQKGILVRSVNHNHPIRQWLSCWLHEKNHRVWTVFQTCMFYDIILQTFGWKVISHHQFFAALIKKIFSLNMASLFF